jgi:hypothetical protein
LLQSKQPAFFPKKESSKRIQSQHTTPRNIIEFLKTSKIMIEKKSIKEKQIEQTIVHKTQLGCSYQNPFSLRMKRYISNELTQ